MSNSDDAWAREIIVGVVTDLTLFGIAGLSIAERTETKMVLFYCDLGIVTAQKIETLEFDGWEIWEGFNRETYRFEDLLDAHAQIKLIFRRWHLDDIGEPDEWIRETT